MCQPVESEIRHQSDKLNQNLVNLQRYYNRFIISIYRRNYKITIKDIHELNNLEAKIKLYKFLIKQYKINNNLIRNVAQTNEL